MTNSVGGGGDSPGFVKGMAYILTGKPIDGSKAKTPLNINPKGKKAEMKMDEVRPQLDVIKKGQENFDVEKTHVPLSQHKAKQKGPDPDKSFLKGAINNVGSLVSGKKDKSPEGPGVHIRALDSDMPTSPVAITNDQKIKPFNSKASIQNAVVLQPMGKDKERAAPRSPEFLDNMIRGDKDAIRKFMTDDPKKAGTRDSFQMLKNKLNGILLSNMPDERKSVLINNILNIAKEYHAIHASSLQHDNESAQTFVEIHSIAKLSVSTNDEKVNESLNKLQEALHQPRSSPSLGRQISSKKLDVIETRPPRLSSLSPADQLRHLARALNPKSSKKELGNAWNLYKETLTSKDAGVQEARGLLLQKLKDLTRPKNFTDSSGIPNSNNERAFAYTEDKNAKDIQRDFAAILDHSVVNISDEEIDAFKHKENFIIVDTNYGYKGLNPQVAPNLAAQKTQGKHLTALIAEEILLTGSPRERHEIVTKYLDAANLAYQKGNFNTVFSIMTALGASEISRLPEVRNLNNHDSYGPIKERLENFISPVGQFRSYREEIERRASKNIPFVPFWGRLEGMLGMASDDSTLQKVKDLFHGELRMFRERGSIKDLQKGSPQLEIYLENMAMRSEEVRTVFSDRIRPPPAVQ